MSKKAAKVDNHNLAAKLALRRHFLDRYHSGAGTISVLDCCEGEGRIWDTLEASYPCWRWGVDLKPGRGRLVLDSRVILAGDVAYDVVDIDTYGSPWGHWTDLIAHATGPVTAFLTDGMNQQGPVNPETCVRPALGLTFPTLEVPSVLVMKLGSLLPRRMIALAWEYGHRVVEAAEAPNPGGKARYYGVRLEPAGEAA
jgi:hypothetical protein